MNANANPLDDIEQQIAIQGAEYAEGVLDAGGRLMAARGTVKGTIQNTRNELNKKVA